MLSKRLATRISGAEFRTETLQWLRSGQCYRCFHSSQHRRANAQSKSDSKPDTPVTAPKRSSTRQQRAAKVSQEVQMLQRDRPKPSFAEADPNTLRPPGAGKTVDPAAVGKNVGGGSMGANDPASREGPQAQGVNLSARMDVSSQADTRAARKTGQAVTMEDGSERAGSGLDDGLGESDGERLSPPAKEGGASDDVTASTLLQPSASDLRVSDEQDVQSIAVGASTAIPAEIANRLQMLQEPVLSNSKHGDPRATAVAKLKSRKFVQFVSEEDKFACLDSSGDGKSFFPKRLKGLNSAMRRSLLQKTAAGSYDREGLLNRRNNDWKSQNRFPVLDEIERVTRMNGTYMDRDSARVLAKVRSLLAATPAPRTAPKPKGTA